MRLALLCITTHLILGIASDMEYLKSLDDFITYKIAFKPNSEEELQHNDENAKNWVSMMSADDEEYHCLLPTMQTDSKKRIESYSGPSPAELLRPLYDESSCSYRIETYWMYEFCHGRYILQYHDEKETKTRTEFYLGNYAKVQAEAEGSKFDQLNPPMRKFEEEELAYYPVTYGQGTTCDLTNKPRQTTVLYICDEASKSHIHSLNEVSSCNYELVVKTNRLCAHPSFQKAPANELDINCFAANSKQPYSKPRALLSAERESTSDFLKEFTTIKSSVTPTKNVFSQLLQGDESDSFDQLNLILEALKASTSKKITPPPKSLTFSSNEQRLIDQFWNGKACLTGGSGWWKYEICHGRTVVQYHEEPGKERTNIVLGVFHKEVHTKWVDENPHKARKSDDGKVYQVANLYSQGDVCLETGAHRSCEVRIRCQEESSSSKILIYLLEPETCSYILVIESPLMCEGLKKADKYGILPNMPDLNSFEAVEETKRISSKDHADTIQIFKHENLADVAKPNPHIPGSSSVDASEATKDFVDKDETEKPPKKEKLSESTSKAPPKAVRPPLVNFLEEFFEDDDMIEMMHNMDNMNEIIIQKKIRSLKVDDEKEDKDDDEDKNKETRQHDEN